MTVIRAAVVLAALAAASPAAPLASSPVRVTVGGVVTTVPAGAEYERRDWRGVSSISVQPSPGARIELLSYRWWGNLWAGGPTDARRFLEGLGDSEGLQDFQIVSPAIETRFRGEPAWALTRRFRMGNPARGVPDKEVQERYLLVQRRWGFLVLQYDQSPALFAEDEPKFQEFLDRLTLKSEPPLDPLSALALAALLCAGGVYGLLRLRRP